MIATGQLISRHFIRWPLQAATLATAIFASLLTAAIIDYYFSLFSLAVIDIAFAIFIRLFRYSH
jgi:hypothetical protein